MGRLTRAITVLRNKVPYLFVFLHVVQVDAERSFVDFPFFGDDFHDENLVGVGLDNTVRWLHGKNSKNTVIKHHKNNSVEFYIEVYSLGAINFSVKYF